MSEGYARYLRAAMRAPLPADILHAIRTGPDLAHSVRVNAHTIALALAFAASAVATPADAETDRPVVVTVVGRGAIRFRLASGATAPCDSRDNRVVFDGWLTPGRYSIGTGADVICYQHTSGALRVVNWSGSRVVPTLMGNKVRRRPTEIVVATD